MSKTYSCFKCNGNGSVYIPGGRIDHYENCSECRGRGRVAEPMVDCPSCGGYGFDGYEEDTGRPYTCYRCCETGRVTKASADAEEAAEAAYAAEEAAKEAARRKEYGVPDGWGYYYDEYEGDVVFVPPRPAPGAKPAAVDYTDDIPF